MVASLSWQMATRALSHSLSAVSKPQHSSWNYSSASSERATLFTRHIVSEPLLSPKTASQAHLPSTPRCAHVRSRPPYMSVAYVHRETTPSHLVLLPSYVRTHVQCLRARWSATKKKKDMAWVKLHTHLNTLTMHKMTHIWISFFFSWKASSVFC